MSKYSIMKATEDIDAIIRAMDGEASIGSKQIAAKLCTESDRAISAKLGVMVGYGLIVRLSKSKSGARYQLAGPAKEMRKKNRIDGEKRLEHYLSYNLELMRKKLAEKNFDCDEKMKDDGGKVVELPSGGIIREFGNRRVVSLENSHRKLATDTVGSVRVRSFGVSSMAGAEFHL